MRNKLLIAAFVEGFFLVAIEVIYAQLLHPFYGESYFAWLSMLSVTMLASAGGYFFGSFVQSKPDAWIKKYLTVGLLFLSVFFLFVFRISENMFVILQDFSFLEALFIHTVLVLFLPVLLITSASPIIVKYYAKEEQSSGKSSGKVFFTSTIGGIISIYSIAFIFLPNIDLLIIIKALSVVMIGVNLFVLKQFDNTKILLLEVLVLTMLFVGVNKKNEFKLNGINTKIVHREHGIMGEMEIRDERGKHRFLSSNRTTQSAIDKATNNSLWSYPYRVSTYASLAPAKSKVLVAGLGGGVLVNQLIKLDFDVECVEFDKRSYDLSKKYMGLDVRFKLKIDDFRHFINKSEKKYDVIILDLSKGESIPTNVYSVEAFKKMLTLLNEDGFIILHYFSNVYGTGDFGLHSIMKTLDQSGAFFSFARKIEADKSPEQLLFASNNPEIIKYKSFRIPKNVVDNFGIVVQDYFDSSTDYSDGVLLNDDVNSLEKVQFEVVKGIRDKLRINEYNAFYK